MSKWAVVENGDVVEYYDVLPNNWRNISNIKALEFDLETLATLSWYPVIENIQPLGQNQAYGNTTFTFDADNKNVIKNVEVIDLPPRIEVVIDLKEEFFNVMRVQRNLLLSESDWTQLADIISIKGSIWHAAWSSYRQSLRDLPEYYSINYPDETNPGNIQYPVPPYGI